MSDDTKRPDEDLPDEESRVPEADDVQGEPTADDESVASDSEGVASEDGVSLAADAEPAEATTDDGAYQAARPVSPLSVVFFLGLALLLIGLIWWQVEQETTTALVIWLFASLVAVLSPLAWHAVDLFDSLKSRRTVAFVYVLLTLTLGTVGLTAVSAANFTLHERGQLPAADLTETGEFSLGEETRNLFDRVQGTIYFTYVENNSPPNFRQKAYDQLKLYSFEFANVNLQKVNPIRHPAHARRQMADWGITEPPKGEMEDLLVVTFAPTGKEIERGRTKRVELDPNVWVTQSALGETEWLGERIISSSVMELVFERKHAYVTGGHGEDPFSERFRRFRERISSQNIDLKDAPLILAQNPQVPADCDLLFVMNPKTAFEPAEVEAIGRWLDASGGTLFVALDVIQDDGKTGLERLLADYGLEPRQRYMVMAPDVRGMTNPDGGRPNLILAGFKPNFAAGRTEYEDHEAVKALRKGMGRSTFFFQTSFITVSERESANGATAKAVVNAPFPRPVPGSQVDARSWAVRMQQGRDVPPAPDRAKDVTGTELCVIATSERSTSAGRDARIVLTGDTDLFWDAQLQSGRETNLDLAVGLVQWGLQREGLISISNATLASIGKAMTPRLSRVAFWWTLGTAFLPLILGGAVWWYRRR